MLQKLHLQKMFKCVYTEHSQNFLYFDTSESVYKYIIIYPGLTG